VDIQEYIPLTTSVLQCPVKGQQTCIVNEQLWGPVNGRGPVNVSTGPRDTPSVRASQGSAYVQVDSFKLLKATSGQ
jgi:hypothetical protein